METTYEPTLAMTVVFLLLIFMVILISLMLFSLAKHGDERKSIIKEKAMSKTFIVVIVILFIQIINSFITDTQLEGLNPVIFLAIIALAFLTSLLYYRRKYGG
ncbi:DUF2178 domain-containing protein [Dethiobacter alkaliphilus]|uniref:DUF2178 domain-containing protein n=1 Tax=Dethiobacter alkaliphilus TaxID=427926 RepID=UPI00222806ED|nr:DUF2178 domain-containing protein [Dethiobacter alkaliphilus]MCW3490998.1 DUF2178 domain-containing protein [Dethiobacter alkaliphilus]